MSHGPVLTPQFTTVQLTRTTVFGADPKAESLFEDTRNRRSYYSGEPHSYVLRSKQQVLFAQSPNPLREQGVRLKYDTPLHTT